MSRKQIYNPYLPSFEYIPDGEPHLFEGRIYVYGSHDRFAGAEFCLNDYICYSADVTDLTDWRYEGIIYRKEQDPRNQNIPADAPAPRPGRGVEPDGPDALNPAGIHAMWAPDVVKGLDGKYYLYYCLDYLPQIGVAVCDTPAGQYEYLGLVCHKDGTPLGEKAEDLNQFDPGIFIDEDDTIYLYSGNAPMHREHKGEKQGSQVMKLERDMLTLKEEPKMLLPNIHQGAGTGYEGHEFFEASSIRKINGRYYFVYSSVNSHELCYAVSDRPDEGYEYGGTLVDIGDIYLDGRTAENSVNPLGNTHGGIECADGKWYVFYHRQTNRTNYSRQGCAERIHFAPDGRIAQAEVTSCGLNDGPLDGCGSYPAGICCHLTGKDGAVFSHPLTMNMDYPYLTQTVRDMEPVPETIEQDRRLPYQYIANIQDGTVIGYKYFLMNGLTSITMKVRGSGEGKFIVTDRPKGDSMGEIACRIAGSEWCDVNGTVSVPDGMNALYFTYVGSGAIDFVLFSLH